MKHWAAPPPGIGQLTSADGSVHLTPPSGKGRVVDLSVPLPPPPSPSVYTIPINISSGQIRALKAPVPAMWMVGGTNLNGSYCLMVTFNRGATWSTWTLAQIGIANGVNGIFYLNSSTWIVIDIGGPYAVTTNAGTSWTVHSAKSLLGNNEPMQFFNALYIACDRAGNLASSPDLTTWTDCLTTTNAALNLQGAVIANTTSGAVAAAGSVITGGGIPNALCLSTDGTHYTTTNLDSYVANNSAFTDLVASPIDPSVFLCAGGDDTVLIRAWTNGNTVTTSAALAVPNHPGDTATRPQALAMSKDGSRLLLGGYNVGDTHSELFVSSAPNYNTWTDLFSFVQGIRQGVAAVAVDAPYWLAGGLAGTGNALVAILGV